LNFLLLRPDEIDGAGHATLRGRRADHVRTVLRATVGQELKAGMLGGLLGTATVRSVANDAVVVAASLHDEPAPTPDVLLLAVPRPKVLMRMLAHAAALGFGRIVLFRSWRVEKSHLQSTAMRPEVQREHLLLGLEQAGRTRMPSVQYFPLFKPMVEDHLQHLPDTRFVAHPAAPTNTHELALGPGSAFVLALGPDGGFLPYEVARLADRGFLPISCGKHPQRTETALAVLWGQLALLRARGSLR